MQGDYALLFQQEHLADQIAVWRSDPVEVEAVGHGLAGIVGGIPYDGIFASTLVTVHQRPHGLAESVVDGQLNHSVARDRIFDSGLGVERVGVVVERHCSRDRLRRKCWRWFKGDHMPAAREHIEFLGRDGTPLCPLFSQSNHDGCRHIIQSEQAKDVHFARVV